MLSDVPGLLCDTERFSAVDGPGNRFTVFLQGCNFNCRACHNPYTIEVCNDCGECLDHCPSDALSWDETGLRVRWDAGSCDGSDRCITVCPYDSTPKAQRTRVGEVVEDIRAVAPFLSGVTVSGGEPTRQPRFVAALFGALKADPDLGRLTTFVDSNGSAPPALWDDLLPVMDGAMIDLKAFDPDVHEELTDQSNDAVLASIAHLYEHDRLYEVRLLLVPGVNDDPAPLRATAAWLASTCPDARLKLIGFRPHGVRGALGQAPAATAEELARFEDFFAGGDHEIVRV